MSRSIAKELDFETDFDKKQHEKVKKNTGVREHCYRKKAATVGQDGRLSDLCNFFSF